MQLIKTLKMQLIMRILLHKNVSEGKNVRFSCKQSIFLHKTWFPFY